MYCCRKRTPVNVRNLPTKYLSIVFIRCHLNFKNGVSYKFISIVILLIGNLKSYRHSIHYRTISFSFLIRYLTEMFTFFFICCTGLLQTNLNRKWLQKNWLKERKKSSTLAHSQCWHNRSRTTHRSWSTAETTRNCWEESRLLTVIVTWSWKMSKKCGPKCPELAKARRRYQSSSLL